MLAEHCYPLTYHPLLSTSGNPRPSRPLLCWALLVAAGGPLQFCAILCWASLAIAGPPLRGAASLCLAILCWLSTARLSRPILYPALLCSAGRTLLADPILDPAAPSIPILCWQAETLQPHPIPPYPLLPVQSHASGLQGGTGAPLHCPISIPPLAFPILARRSNTPPTAAVLPLQCTAGGPPHSVALLSCPFRGSPLRCWPAIPLLCRPLQCSPLLCCHSNPIAGELSFLPGSSPPHHTLATGLLRSSSNMP